MGIRKRSDGHQKVLQCPLDGTVSPNWPKFNGGNAFAIRRDFLNDGPVIRQNASNSPEKPTCLYLIYSLHLCGSA